MKHFTRLALLVLLFASFLTSCKKDKDEDPKPTEEAVLKIQTPAQNVEPSQSVNYTAVFVKKDGTTEAAANVTWSTSNSSVASFSGSSLSAVGIGECTVTATATYNNKQVSASVVLGVKVPGLFTVVPGAVVWEVNAPGIQLEPVYIGTGNPGTYTFSSSNSSIATISSTGMLECKAAGFCVITVTAPGLEGQPTYTVPVQVVGMPDVQLPVARINITPGGYDLLKNETYTFTAKAYDLSNNEKQITFNWKSADNSIATVDQAGKVTAVALGTTQITAESNGVIGQAEITVFPNKIIEVTPFYVSLAPGAQQQFTAKTYNVARNGNDYSLSLTTNPSDLKWEIPTYGMSIFDVATTDQTGKVTVKTDAMQGMMTFLVAYSQNDPEIGAGGAAIMVGMASTCDCGSNNLGVATIQTNVSSISLSMFNSPTAQIIATAKDALGNTVSGADIRFCSDNEQVATVDAAGNVTGIMQGNATITVCVGTITKTIPVTVTF